MKAKATPPSIWLVMALACLDMMAMGIVIPVLPLLIEGLVGQKAAALWTGAIASIWAVVQFACAPFIGVLSDRFGRRPVILLSTIGLAASWMIMAGAPDLAWLVAGRVIGGITSASGSAIFAYVTDITPAQERTRAFGLVGAALSAGFVAGPALGGLIGHADPRLPLWVAAGLSAAACAYGLFVLPESLPPESRGRHGWHAANPLGSLALLRSGRALARLGLSHFLLNCAHRLYTSVFVLFAAHRYGMGVGEVGLLLAFTGVLDLFIQGGLASRASRALGDTRCLVLGLLGGGAGLVLMGLAPTRALFIAALVVNAIWGIAEPAMRALMTAQVPSDRQGQLQGAMHCVMSLSGMIAPVFFGWVYARTLDGFSGLCFLIAAGAVAGAALLGARAGVPGTGQPA